MSSKDLPPIVFKRSADEMPNQPITIRQEPTTASQKADLFIADTIGLIKKYKWLWIILILIPCILAFVYLIASQPTWKQAIVAFFEGMWGIIVWISGFIIPYFWIALLLIFIGYKPIKKLLSKEKISFDEFGGENEEIMTMRRGGDETILYRDRGNFLETIFRGKEKIHITNSTFDMLKSVGNKKQLFFEDEAHDILRVPIMPQTELPDQEKFKLMPDGRKTFNGLFLLDHEDIEEYMLKSMIPGVNAELLKNTLFNLTKKLNRTQQRVADLETNFHDELEREFINYQISQVRKLEQGKMRMRMLYKKLKEEEDEAAQYSDYLKQMSQSYGAAVYPDGEYYDEYE